MALIVEEDLPPLTKGDLVTPAYLRLAEYYQARLNELRALNDGPLTPVETELLRGRIMEVKHFLSFEGLINEEPVIENERQW